MENLRPRFKELWKSIDAIGSFEKIYQDLVREYSTNKRFYHDLNHISSCLKDFDLAKHILNDANAVEIAIFYHDIFYDTHSNVNEEKSAELAYRVCKEADLSLRFCRKVSDFILLTKHNSTLDSSDREIMVDIDLAILGKSEKEFNEYDKNIRKEYSWVSESDFAEGRRKILQGFLDRSRIYYSDFFFDKYEKKARKNLQKVLKRLY